MSRGHVTPGSSHTVRRLALGVVAVLVVLPVLSPLVVGAPTASHHQDDTLAAAVGAASITSPLVTWNAKNVASAGSTSSAISMGRGQTATVNFTYYATGPAANASLELTYLGVVLTAAKAQAREVLIPAVSGAAAPLGWLAQINWSFGPLLDALEGVFQFTASIQAPNGSTLWSETFYVFAKAPYLLGSGAVIVLLILTVAELYWGISAIREARRGPRPAKPKGQAPSESTGASSSASGPTAAAPQPGGPGPGSSPAPPPGPGAGSGGAP